MESETDEQEKLVGERCFGSQLTRNQTNFETTQKTISFSVSSSVTLIPNIPLLALENGPPTPPNLPGSGASGLVLIQSVVRDFLEKFLKFIDKNVKLDTKKT